uniref:Uncharacterized protein n=1 Tax=Cacopsylla melanoneura TaxID=428564 RepID=A0A8D9B296_9HEMI
MRNVFKKNSNAKKESVLKHKIENMVPYVRLYCERRIIPFLSKFRVVVNIHHLLPIIITSFFIIFFTVFDIFDIPTLCFFLMIYFYIFSILLLYFFIHIFDT